DIIVRGEGEITMKEICSGLPVEKITGITHKGGQTADRPVIEDIDILPIPAYHLVDFKKYYPPVGGYRQLPAMLMVTSRGCVNLCTYCYQPFGKRIRQRSAEKLLEEVRLLALTYGIRELSIYDDNFSTRKKNVERFCELLIGFMKKEKIKMTWSCFARADWLRPKTALLMKKAGCHHILFGVESADEQVRKNINKNLHMDRVIKTSRMIKKIGIQTRASFMFGLPGDTKETMEETIKLALKIDPDLVHFNILAPNPGTPVYKWGVENGYIEPGDWESYDLATVKLKIPTATEEEILKAYKDAHRRFHFRPRFIFKRLIRSFTPLGFMANWQGLKAILTLIRN
ncbi:MAG: radical SAM protein, partial [bacterium]